MLTSLCKSDASMHQIFLSFSIIFLYIVYILIYLSQYIVYAGLYSFVFLVGKYYLPTIFLYNLTISIFASSVFMRMASTVQH